MRKDHGEVHPAEEPAQRAPGALPLDVRARGLDELAIGDARGADRLAGATAEAEIQVRGGGVGEADAPLRHGLDEEDAPARGIHLAAENGNGGAVRGSEAA